MTDYLQDFLDNDAQEFTQVNVRIPVNSKERMLAYAANLRAAQTYALSLSEDLDVLYFVADKNMPQVPNLTIVMDERKAYNGTDAEVHELLESATDMLMKFQRQVGLIQNSKKDSEAAVLAHAKAVGLGMQATALWNTYKLEHMQ
jgi:hypothetical protein